MSDLHFHLKNLYAQRRATLVKLADLQDESISDRHTLKEMLFNSLCQTERLIKQIEEALDDPFLAEEEKNQESRARKQLR